MDTGNRRPKRIASLIKEALSPFLIEIVQANFSTIATITNIKVSNDLRSAYVLISLINGDKKEEILDFLRQKTGYFRKSIASKTKLKYNPMLFFSLDPTHEYEDRIDSLLKNIIKDEK